MKKSKSQEAYKIQSMKEYNEAEDNFDKERLRRISEFLYLGQLYRNALFNLGYGCAQTEVVKLADGEYQYVVHTLESEENKYVTAPAITSDTNHLKYWESYSDLEGELRAIEFQIEERDRLYILKTKALNKLSEEEKKVLGL